MLRTNKFRIAKASTFEDENEAIELILKGLQIIAGPCRGGIGNSWEGDHNAALSAHIKTKHSAYISSWTTSPESVAMWSLYSINQVGVRIKTKLDKLESLAQDYRDKNKPSQNYKADNDFTSGVTTAYVKPVSYVNVKNMFKRVSRRKKAYDKVEEKLLANGIQPYNPGGPPDSYERYNNFLGLPSLPYLIKDEAYSHEHEVRMVLRLGKFSHKAFLKICEATKSDIKPRSILEVITELEGHDGGLENCDNEDFLDMAYMDITNNFIEEICIDPRTPLHISNEIKSILEQFNIPIVTSDAFGYKPDKSYFSEGFITR